jgi:hypothetical protein
VTQTLPLDFTRDIERRWQRRPNPPCRSCLAIILADAVRLAKRRHRSRRWRLSIAARGSFTRTAVPLLRARVDRRRARTGVRGRHRCRLSEEPPMVFKPNYRPYN